MTGHTFAIADHADPELVGRYQAGLAKLKPACSRCGRVLAKRELDARRCANTDDCRLRQIFAGPKHAGGKSLNLSEVHELQRLRDLPGAA